jgi:hypothetical protein
MECKIPHADDYRRKFPHTSDEYIRQHFISVNVTYPPSRSPAYRTPEWCVYRALIRREARKRGITL